MKKASKKIPLILALALCIALLLPGMSASAEYLGEYPVGEEIGWIPFYTSNLIINGVYLTGGSLPAGVEVQVEDYGIFLTGIPQNRGYFSANYMIETSEAALYADVSMTIVNAPDPTPATGTGNGQGIVITKNPTGEYVEAGGEAVFVARANNAETLIWRLVSPDASDTVRVSDSADYFPGLQASGVGTERLVLSYIPSSLDGWYVEAQFWNGNQHVESSGAKITIVDAEGIPVANRPAAVTPTPVATQAPSLGSMEIPVDNEARTANISIQPQSIEIMPGDSYTLSVVATSPNNGVLSYQWYSAATNNRSASLPIGGATDASYTINQADGTAFYWVAVWNTKDGTRSQAAYSEAAEVRITVPATPTPIPTPTPTPTPAPRSSGGPSSISFQLILFGIIGVLALIALIGVVIYLRADAKQRDTEDDRYDDR